MCREESETYFMTSTLAANHTNLEIIKQGVSVKNHETFFLISLTNSLANMFL
jgi:hypothetical protein